MLQYFYNAYIYRDWILRQFCVLNVTQHRTMFPWWWSIFTLVTSGSFPSRVAVARPSHVVTGGVVETFAWLPTAITIGTSSTLWKRKADKIGCNVKCYSSLCMPHNKSNTHSLSHPCHTRHITQQYNCTSYTSTSSVSPTLFMKSATGHLVLVMFFVMMGNTIKVCDMLLYNASQNNVTLQWLLIVIKNPMVSHEL